MQESGWRQFCVPDTPADQVGGAARTIISFDCGYGVGQVTSGMHKGETPAFDRARVAGDATYNLATGTLILADKWRATNCVGDNQPRTVEDWYVATWAYNGLAFVNNPNNPNYSATRGVCDPERRLHRALSGAHLRLDGAPAVGGALGAARRRLSRSRRHPGDGRDGARPARAEAAPRRPTAPSTRATHTSECLGDTSINDGGADDGGGGPARHERRRRARTAAAAPSAVARQQSTC